MKNLSTAPHSNPTTNNFDDWWQMNGTWVEEPNQRRGGESGVMRCELNGDTFFVKKQVGHFFRSLRHPLGCPTIVREAHRLSICEQLGVVTPEVIYCDNRVENGEAQAVLVTRDLAGYECVQDWYNNEPDGPIKDRVLDVIYRRLAESLAKLHNQRWQHGCLYDKHVFFRIKPGDNTDVDVALIDLEKCRRRLSVARASERDVLQMCRHMPGLDGPHWHSFVEAYTQHINLKSGTDKKWLSLTH